MRHLINGVIVALVAGAFFTFPAAAQMKPDTGQCIVFDNKALPGPDTDSCKGGPLKSGDSRLGRANSSHAADRKAPPSRHSFDVGGTAITISGSVRVEGVYAQ